MDDELNSGGTLHEAAPIDFSSPTDTKRAKELREQAARCRRLCSSVLDPRTQESLKAMAREYESEADGIERGES